MVLWEPANPSALEASPAAAFTSAAAVVASVPQDETEASVAPLSATSAPKRLDHRLQQTSHAGGEAPTVARKAAPARAQALAEAATARSTSRRAIAAFASDDIRTMAGP